MYTCKKGEQVIYQPFPCAAEQHNLSVEQRKQVQTTSFFNFVKQGDEIKVQSLLQQGASIINTIDEFNKPPLFYALENKHYNLAKLLILSGASVEPISHEANNSQKSVNLLQHFCEQQDLTAVEILLIAEAQPNVVDSLGITPLIIAVDKKSPQLIQLLLRYNADINLLSKSDNKDTVMSPLMFFVTQNDLSATKLLLNLGAKINLANEQNLSALSTAALTGNVAIVDSLLQAGADPRPIIKDPELWEFIQQRKDSKIAELISIKNRDFI